MKKLLAIGILCLSSISNAYEVPNGYILSAEDVSGNKYYVHKESIRKMGNLTYVWIISTNHVKFGKNTSAYIRRLYSYNCDTWQNKIVEETFFDDKGGRATFTGALSTALAKSPTRIRGRFSRKRDMRSTQK